MKKLMAILFVLFSQTAFSATICKDYSNAGNNPTASLRKRGSDISLQVERLSGAGAVGSYQIQVSNSDITYVNEGAAVSSAGITEVTGVTEQFVRVSLSVPPDVGTVVRICLYADGISE